MAPLADVRRAADSQNFVHPRTLQLFRMSPVMNTSSVLRSLCAAAYPLVSVGAIAAAALCLTAPPAQARTMPSNAAPAPSRHAFQDAAITPQARRAPELPVGCVV
jgi:hypothetical protein